MDNFFIEEHRFSNDTGDAGMAVYSVFPGIQLVFNSVHMDRCDLGRMTAGNLIEIHHCLEGRIEQEFEDERFYLGPGDFSIAIRDRMVNAYHFPTCHYHGITIGINADLAPESLSDVLEEVRVRPLEVARNLCGERNSFFIRGEQYIQHIFSQLYAPMPEEIKRGFFQVKILELMLTLQKIQPQSNPVPGVGVAPKQAQLAKQTAAYLVDHSERRVTIPELAKHFNVSQTVLKDAFRAVYGVPVYAYTRIQKMQAAGQRLIHTDRKMSEIAAEFGYQNESKFIAAFRDVMGESPGEYRRAHSKQIIK